YKCVHRPRYLPEPVWKLSARSKIKRKTKPGAKRRHRIGKWRASVRRRFGFEPSDQMWELLGAVTSLRSELGGKEPIEFNGPKRTRGETQSVPAGSRAPIDFQTQSGSDG